VLCGQRVLNFLGEDTFSADFSQGYIRNLVTSGVNDLDVDFVAAFAQAAGNVICLPESQL
jgi:hypothetical protein